MLTDNVADARSEDSVKALALQWFAQMRTGQIDRTQLTADYGAQLTDDAVSGMSQYLNRYQYGASPLGATILLTRSDEGQTFHVVKIVFPRGDAASLMFGFNTAGKITGITLMSMAGDDARRSLCGPSKWRRQKRCCHVRRSRVARVDCDIPGGRGGMRIRAGRRLLRGAGARCHASGPGLFAEYSNEPARCELPEDQLGSGQVGRRQRLGLLLLLGRKRRQQSSGGDPEVRPVPVDTDEFVRQWAGGRRNGDA